MKNKVYITTDGTEFSNKEDAIEYQNLDSMVDKKAAIERKKYLALKEDFNKAESALEYFQQNCKHEYVKITPHANTGNYDPHDNCYWYSIECKCCEYIWSEDQDKCTFDLNDSKVEVVRNSYC